MMPFQVKRVYDSPHGNDGLRILVERLWPRGLTKQDAVTDQWLRACAPSDELRKWFGHDRARWEEFKKRYFAELRANEELLAPIRALARGKRVTLLFGSSEIECNNAVALMEYLGMEYNRITTQFASSPTWSRVGIAHHPLPLLGLGIRLYDREVCI